MRASASLIVLAASLSPLAGSALHAQQTEEDRNAILKVYAFALVAERYCEVEIDAARLERLLTRFGSVAGGILNEPGYKARFNSYFDMAAEQTRSDRRGTCDLLTATLDSRGIGLVRPRK